MSTIKQSFQRNMSFTTIMIIWMLFYQLEKCFGTRVEINVTDKSGSNTKLICQPSNNKSSENTDDKSNILWEGIEFGPNEQKKVALDAPSNMTVPNLNLSANHMKCLLKALKSKKNITTKLLDGGVSRRRREMARKSFQFRSL